jgi:hypothetical protein
MVDAVAPSGLVLDLQVIRPQPVVEIDGGVVCVVDAEPSSARPTRPLPRSTRESKQAA